MVPKASAKSSLDKNRVTELLEEVERLIESNKLTKEKINRVIQKLKDELAVTDNEKVRMAAHDIRNILALVSALKHEEVWKNYKEDILSRVREMRETLEKEYSPKEENLTTLIKDEIERNKILAKDVSIQGNLQEDTKGEVDRYLIKSMIRNLITNSIQNMTENDTPNKQINITLKDKKDHIEIIHEDTGTGIPMGVDPLAGKTTRKGGSGTGGQIIKKVVELHGGEITWENKKEGGVRFTIKLPKKRRKVK